jgi:hypothetical protein
MIRMSILFVFAVIMLTIIATGLAGRFGGLALFAVCVTVFGLLVSLCTEKMREE